MWFDKVRFHKSANEVLNDIETGYIKSAAWLWIAGGAIAGFVASCVKLKRKTGRPVVGRFYKKEEKNSGRF